MKLFLLMSAVLTVCFAEAPLSGPYAPSGWKPRGPQFTLPAEFSPSSVQQQNGRADVDLTKQQVDFAGQTTETEISTAEPNKAYLPSETDYPEDSTNKNVNYLKVQGLPNEENINPFDIAPDQYQLNNNRQLGQFRQQQGQQQDNFDNEEFSQQDQPHEEDFNQQQQFGRNPSVQQNFNEFQQQGAEFEQQVVVAPASEYGAPRNAPIPVIDSDDESDVQDTTGENGQSSIAVANSVQNGRYYVLTPDNNLQRVIFKTSQNPEEAKKKGFTAQLRYMPVEPIRDPIYVYNKEGVLVRILRK